MSHLHLTQIKNGRVDTLFNKDLIPLLAVEDLAYVVALMSALEQAGFQYLEIVLRTDFSLRAIEKAAKCSKIKILAGTVLTAEQVQSASDAGAQGIVSPGLNKSVIDETKRCRLPIIPGVHTASEIMQAKQWGIQTCKVFPANIVGGVDWLNAMKGPFPNMRFFPTGGINKANYLDYVSCNNVVAVGGTFLLPKTLSKRIDVTELTAFMNAVNGDSVKQ